MEVRICKDKVALGASAAQYVADRLNQLIDQKGHARLVLSTGASQFDTLDALTREQVDWSKVDMFHLDEYVGMSKDHPASFNCYLTHRFVEKVHPGQYHLIDGERDPQETIAELTALLDESPVDVGLIGIGENGHIAFNDPPADFEDKRAYKVVTLDDRCLQQQVGEGWFASKEEAYKQAISMTCDRIMQCRSIISVVPYKVKAEAIYNTLTNDVTNRVPATLLKTHPDTTIYCDPDSAALLNEDILAKYR